MEKPIKYFANLSIKFTCPECGNPFFLNGPNEKNICQYCMSEIIINRETIIDIIKETYKNIPIKLMKEEHKVTVLGQENYSFRYRNKPPECNVCKAEIPPEKFIVYENKNHWNILCDKCNNLISVDKVPDWIQEKLPSAKILINAVINQNKQNTGKKTEIKGIVFSCPKCSASLEVDGEERIIKCKYCNSSVYIPDDLWLRLHPTQKRRVWNIGFTKIKASKNILEPSEIKKKKIEIERLHKSVTKKKEEIKNYEKIIARKSEELKNLGIFKGREKKKLKAEIETKRKEIENVRKTIKSIEKNIKAIEKKIK